jgi:hypothetical protein
MVIEGTECHFNDATSISFEGDATYPPLFSVILPPTKILVFSIITRAGFSPAGTGEVTVTVRSRVEEGGGSYEEVGSSTLSLVMLPLIFAGEQGK